MYWVPCIYQCVHCMNLPNHTYVNPLGYGGGFHNPLGSYQTTFSYKEMTLKDYGANPFVIDIDEATKRNDTFRTALWTGNHLQLTVMSVNAGEYIGLEMHPDVDQFLRVEQGRGIVQMGKDRDKLNYQSEIMDDSGIIIPAGMWHNVINTGNIPLKLYSIYAPPNHPFGTVHQTKADAMNPYENDGLRTGDKGKVVKEMTPDDWIRYTEFLVKEGLEDVDRGINMTHILQEFILMGVLVGQGYSPESAYETVEEWERTGESKLLQQSKRM